MLRDCENFAKGSFTALIRVIPPATTIADTSVPRFLMNGKAVCLMSVAMFTARVPLGGKLLYRDFQIRLANALYNKL